MAAKCFVCYRLSENTPITCMYLHKDGIWYWSCGESGFFDNRTDALLTLASAWRNLARGLGGGWKKQLQGDLARSLANGDDTIVAYRKIQLKKLGDE